MTSAGLWAVTAPTQTYSKRALWWTLCGITRSHRLSSLQTAPSINTRGNQACHLSRWAGNPWLQRGAARVARLGGESGPQPWQPWTWGSWWRRMSSSLRFLQCIHGSVWDTCFTSMWHGCPRLLFKGLALWKGNDGAFGSRRVWFRSYLVTRHGVGPL